MYEPMVVLLNISHIYIYIYIYRYLSPLFIGLSSNIAQALNQGGSIMATVANRYNSNFNSGSKYLAHLYWEEYKLELDMGVYFFMFVCSLGSQ